MLTCRQQGGDELTVESKCLLETTIHLYCLELANGPHPFLQTVSEILSVCLNYFVYCLLG